MEAVTTIARNVARIELRGEFTFEGHRAFKLACQQVLDTEGVDHLEIDLSGVDYLDSAALGMLLLLNERFGHRTIRLLRAKGSVRAVLDMANFSRVFVLE
ncbi:STAS domain-containing protein [Chitinimonas lacunae]|uniref:STAS domain-containing protein n=1 Tax=Chitinimonas lacunae TaxID=1963018 RepID=A0ABV8MSE8_9NEIS